MESDRLDSKTNADDLGPTIAAMAMPIGGTILVGIRERPAPITVTGVAQPARTIDRAVETGQKCGVSVEAEAVGVGEVAVVVCAVPQVTGRIVSTPDDGSCGELAPRTFP